MTGPGFLAVAQFGSPTLSPVSELTLFHSLPVCRQSGLLTGEGVREEANHIRRRESLVFYQTFNTL